MSCDSRAASTLLNNVRSTFPRIFWVPHPSRYIQECVCMRHDSPNTPRAKCGANCALLAMCTDRLHTRNAILLTFWKKNKSPIVLRTFENPLSKKIAALLVVHAWVCQWTHTALVDPPDWSGFCPFPSWQLAHHTSKRNRVGCVITLRSALSNKLLFFAALQNGQSLRYHWTSILMISSRQAAPEQTVARSSVSNKKIGRFY